MSRRMGRWVYNSDSTLYGEAGWHLDGSPVVLDFMPGHHGCCDGGPRCCHGCYLIYGLPGYTDSEPVDRYLAGAMEWAEKEWDKVRAAKLASMSITRDELAAALAELAKRTGNGDAYFPALATPIFEHVEAERVLAALGG